MEKIFVTQPTLAPLGEYTELLKTVWASGIMTHNGPLVQKFEHDFCQYEMLDNIVTVTNGTYAIQAAIRALNIRGEIITSPFSFIATTSAILYEGCTPVYVDIDPETFNIDPQKIEYAITDKTVAIMPVHVFGNPCNIEAIEAIATKYHLKVIYDGAHAVGSRYKGKALLSFGDISATSFHATKMLNTAEGGGCITSNNELLKKLQMLRFFGYNDHKDVEIVGSNYKMTEVNAALGLANLKYLKEAIADRKRKYNLYKEILSCRNDLSFQKLSGECNCSYFPVVFRSEADLLLVQDKLLENNIVPRRYFYPSLNTYKTIVPYKKMPFSESLAERILCLPLYFNLSESDVIRIGEIICKSF